MNRLARLALAMIVWITVLSGQGSTPCALAKKQTDIPGPAGSGAFGKVTLLPNGNIVVVDASYDAPGPITDAGAVRSLQA